MTTIKELHWSKHIRCDREDRMTEILSTVGLGEIIVEDTDGDGFNKRCGTSTGCLLVVSPTNWVITAYLMGFRQACSLFKGQVPPALYRQIEQNYLHINSMKEKEKGKYDDWSRYRRAKKKETMRKANERRMARRCMIEDE